MCLIVVIMTCRLKDSGPVKLWDQDMKRCKAFTISEGVKKADIVKSVCRLKV